MNRRPIIVAIIATIVIVALAALVFWATTSGSSITDILNMIPGIATSTPSTSVTVTDGVSVSGDHMVRSGQTFIVKGVIFEGEVAPDAVLDKNEQPFRAAFGAPLLQDAKNWGANTIRFNFSQGGLDPQNPIYNESGYIAEVKSDVALARSMGFAVIVTDQDENISQDPIPPPVRMPTAATLRADLTLTSLFKDDPGVIIDLFNEPQIPPSNADWQLWLNGGNYQVNATTTEAMVGFQQLVNGVRQAGSKNVLLVGGLSSGLFTGFNVTITDPLNEIVYDPHLLNPGRTGNSVKDWQANFGFLADEGKPVLLGAFNADTGAAEGNNKWCQLDPGLDLPQTFLNYLAQKHIGVVGWAFDHAGTIVSDYNGTPTTYVGKKCGDENGGSGVLLQQQFLKT